MAAALEPSFGQSRHAWPASGWGFSSPSEPDDPDLALDWHEFEPVAALPPLPVLKEHHKHLDHVPDAPLGALPRAAIRLRENWKLAVAASLVLHGCAALFLFITPPETAEIAGEDSAGIAFLGNAPDDQLSSGDLAEKDVPDSVEVTMIQMLDAKPVETSDADAVPVDSRADKVETVVAESPVTETVSPVNDGVVQQQAATRTIQATPETVKPAPGDTPPAVAAATLAPEILAVETLKPATDDNIVQPANTATPVEAVEAETSTPVAVAQAVQPEPVAKPAEPEVRKPVADQQKAAPKPMEKKAVEQPKKAQHKKEPPKKVAAQPDPKKEQAAKSGAGGGNQTDARRGQADGQVDGSSVTKSKGGARNGQAGNAAVSNYPGKVRSKLARTFGARRIRARGDVVVAFSVSANGGVRSARVVSSSGQAELDRAALDAVHRASPFPPIPAGAGRSSWDFKIPLSVRR